MGDLTFINGVASFTLKHGESKIITGLPAGESYTVIEHEANRDDYVTTSTGDQGTIKADEESVAIFVNHSDLAEVPQTGDNNHLALWIALALLSALGITLVLVGGKKRSNHP